MRPARASTSSSSVTPSPTTAAAEEEHASPLELNVADMRATTWNSVPEEDRKQKNFKLQVIQDPNLREAVIKLKVKIRSTFKDKRPFVVCNADRIEVDHTNFNILKNGDSLMLMDNKDHELPLCFYQEFSTAPHSKAVTSQKGAYHGTPRHNVAAFALADLVDNSLSATSGVLNRRIEIRFYDNSINSAIHVLDNGRGMTSEALQQALIYKAPKATRRFTAETHFSCNDTQSAITYDLDEEVHPLYINSSISMFGAGMKKAVFFLGAQVIIMTKTAGKMDVLENIYSSELLEKNERASREDTWKSSCRLGKAGVPRHTDVSPQVRELITKEELGKENFTHLVIDRLDKDILELLRLKDHPGQECPSIEKQLAHIYHYYIHGRPGNVSVEHLPEVDIIVKRIDSRGNMTSCILADLPKERLDLESELVRTAADSFLFTVDFTRFTNSLSTDERGENRYKVGGIIRYHPIMYSGETIPFERNLRRGIHDRSLNGDDNINIGLLEEEDGANPENVNEREQNVNSGASTSSAAAAAINDPPRKCEDFFSIWWNGRLVPLTQIPSFDWCSPGKSTKNDRLYDRITGSLFFDSHVEEITDNKLNISATKALLDMFNEKKIHQQQSTFLRVTRVANSGRLKAKGKPMKPDFEAWLLKSSRENDKQVEYSRPMSGEEEETIKLDHITYYPYKQAKWNNITLSIGSMVKLHHPYRTSNAGNEPLAMLGKIVKFLVPAKNVEEDSVDVSKVHAPLSLSTVELRPAVLYSESTIIRHMALIDILKTKEAVSLLKDVEKELNMKLIFKEATGPSLNSTKTKILDPIQIDGILMESICFDIVKADGTPRVKGALPHQSNKQAKKIFMVARIHKIRDDGRRELYFTSDVAPYYKGEQGEEPGYYFLLNLKNMEFMKKPGKYIIAFRSYVDVTRSGSGSQSQSRASRNVTGRPASTARRGRSRGRGRGFSRQTTQNQAALPEELPYEVEWENEVDTIGRKIIVCEDGRRIRLPYHEIEFHVVAGTPSTAQIEQVGEEEKILRIGDPFPILISFEDGRDNKAMPPENVAALCPSDKPLVAAASNRRSGVDLSCTWGDLGIVDDMLMIKNVVVTGKLDDCQFKDIKLEVKIQLPNKVISLISSGNRIWVGLPAKLRSCQPSVEIESGEKAKIECCVLDCSDNIINHNQDQRDVKPLVLTCDFYQANDRTERLLTCELLARSALAKNVPETTSIVDVYKFHGRIIPPVTLDCILSYKEFKESVQVNVKPSKQPAFLRAYEIVNGTEREIQVGVKTNRDLGKSIELIFKLFDGLNNPVPFDEQKHALLFDDWPKKSKHHPPDRATLRIPTKAKKQRRVETIAEIKLPGDEVKTIKHHFYFKTTPSDAAKMDVYVWNSRRRSIDGPEIIEVGAQEEVAAAINLRENPGRAQIPIDEEFLYVVVNITDRYLNVITEGMDWEYITAIRLELDNFLQDCEPILANDVTLEDFSGSFLVKFHPPRDPGDKDITFRLGEFVSTLQIQMMPGKPAGLAFEIDGALHKRYHTIPIKNMTNIHVRVHLVDSKQNSTLPEEPISVSIELSDKIPWPEQTHVTRSVIVRPDASSDADAGGIADFGNFVIGVSKDVAPGPCIVWGERCKRPVCFQLQTLTAKVKMPNHAELKAYIKFHVAARNTIPHAIRVDTDGNPFRYIAGSTYENLKVSVIAEDRRSRITNGFQLDQLKMVLTPKSVSARSDKTSKVLTSIALECGVFTFGDVISIAGQYKTKFLLDCGTTSLSHSAEDLVVLSDEMVSLEPEEQLNQDPVYVSGVADAVADRTIVRDFKLILRDMFGNNVNANSSSENVEGSVIIELVEPDLFIGLLRLEQHVSLVGREMRIINGEIIFPPLIVEKNLNLRHNSRYVLRFTARIGNGQKELTYDLRFNILNNILQHKEIKKLEAAERSREGELNHIRSELMRISNEKHQLASARDTAERTLLNHRMTLVTFLNEKAQAEVGQQIVDGLLTHVQIDTREQELRRQVAGIDHARTLSRTAVSSIPPTWDFSPDPAILGQIGRLVEIKSEGRGHIADTKLQRVLSWCMQADLATVVVLNERRGHELKAIHRHASFMLLDIVRDNPYVQQNWNAAIPDPLLGFGHPVYARSLLLLPTDCTQERIAHIRKVFGVILGDTILVDTLEDATRFMKEYNRLSANCAHPNIRGVCPTVVTREGQRLTSKGVIGGGARNQAPPRITDLKHRFGLGPNLDTQQFNEELLKLEELKTALDSRAAAEQDLSEHSDEVHSELVQLKNKEMELNDELQQIKVQLELMKSEQTLSLGGIAAIVRHRTLPTPSPGQQQPRGRSRQLPEPGSSSGDDPTAPKRARQ